MGLIDGHQEFKDQLSNCTSFLFKHGMFLTALELRQELVELHPDIEVPPELDEFLAKAEADALDGLPAEIQPELNVQEDDDGDTTSDAVMHSPVNGSSSPHRPPSPVESPNSASAPPSVTAHQSAAYLEYRLRIVEEELLVAKEELAAQLRRSQSCSEKPGDEADQERNRIETGSQDGCSELTGTERAALNSLVRKYLIDEGHAGLAVALENYDNVLQTEIRDDMTLKAVYRNHNNGYASLLAEIEKQQQKISELSHRSESNHVEDVADQHAQATDGELPIAASQDPQSESQCAVIQPLDEHHDSQSESQCAVTQPLDEQPNLEPVVAPIMVNPSSSSHYPLAIPVERSSCVMDVRNLNPPEKVGPDVHSIFDATREALKASSSDDTAVNSLVLVMRKCLPLLGPVVASTHRVLLIPLLVLAVVTDTHIGDRTDANGIAVVATRRLVAALIRLFGPEPGLLDNGFCIVGAFALLCAHLPEDRLDAEVIMSIIGDRTPKPGLRRVVADSLSIACVVAATRGAACASLLWLRCMPRLVELTNDADPGVRVAAMIGVGRILPHLGAFNVTVGTELLAQILLTGLFADSVEMLSAVHRVLCQLLQCLQASPTWGIQLWVHLLPQISTACHFHPLGAATGAAASLRLMLVFELLCVFTHCLAYSTESIAARLASTGDAGINAEGTEVEISASSMESVGPAVRWIPSENHWTPVLPSSLVEAREAQQWSALVDLGCVELASLKAQEWAPSTTLNSFATNFCETYVTANGDVLQSFNDSMKLPPDQWAHSSPGMPAQPPPPPADFDLPPMAGIALSPPPPEDMEDISSGPGGTMNNVWAAKGRQFAQWADSARHSVRQSVGGALATIESHMEGMARAEALHEMMEAPDLTPRLQERLADAKDKIAAEADARIANVRAMAVRAAEAPLSELLLRIDRVTGHFDMDDIRDAGAPGDLSSSAYTVNQFLAEGQAAAHVDGSAEKALPRMRELNPPPLQEHLIIASSQRDGSVNSAHGFALLAWLCKDLLPFVLDVANRVDWKHLDNEAPLACASHWLCLLHDVFGSAFFNAVVLRQIQIVLGRTWDKQQLSGRAPSDVERAASEEFLVPCAPFSLLCCHVLATGAGLDVAVQRFGLAALHSYAAAEYGWEPHARASVDLLQAIWRRLASAGAAAPTACLSALWPEAHHEAPRNRLAAAAALGAVAVEVAQNAEMLVVRRMAEALLTLGADEDRSVLLVAIEVLGELWLASPPDDVYRQLTVYFDRLVERGNPELLLIAVRAFARAAAELPVLASGGGALESVILPHLNFMAFEASLRHNNALQATIAEALLAAALRRPPLPVDVSESLVLPALREQARKLPESAERLREAIRQLRATMH